MNAACMGFRVLFAHDAPSTRPVPDRLRISARGDDSRRRPLAVQRCGCALGHLRRPLGITRAGDPSMHFVHPAWLSGACPDLCSSTSCEMSGRCVPGDGAPMSQSDCGRPASAMRRFVSIGCRKTVCVRERLDGGRGVLRALQAVTARRRARREYRANWHTTWIGSRGCGAERVSRWAGSSRWSHVETAVVTGCYGRGLDAADSPPRTGKRMLSPRAVAFPLFRGARVPQPGPAPMVSTSRTVRVFRSQEEPAARWRHCI